MYTAGYRYDIKNGLLRKTGSVNIDILPTSAEVFINNVKIISRIPIRLNNLPSGKYTVTIKNEGYFDWQKNIEVVSKETVYIKDIILLKKNNPEMLQTGIVQDLTISPNNQYLIYSLVKNDTKEIWQKNIETAEILLVDVFDTLENLIFTFSPNGNYYIISTEKTPYAKISIINTAQPKKKIDLTDHSVVPIVKYQWKESSAPEIYYATDLQIMSFFPNNSSQSFVTKNIFVDWFLNENQLWAIHENTTTKKMEIMKDVLGFNTVFYSDTETEASVWRILKITNNFVLLKKRNQSEMLLLEQNKKYSLPGEKYLISKYNNWLIVWSSSEIWTHVQNEEPLLLNRSGMQLKQILPLDKYNTLGLVWENTATVLFPYYLVSHEILNQKINFAVTDTNKRIMYFGGKHNDEDGLWKIEY